MLYDTHKNPNNAGSCSNHRNFNRYISQFWFITGRGKSLRFGWFVIGFQFEQPPALLTATYQGVGHGDGVLDEDLLEEGHLGLETGYFLVFRRRYGGVETIRLRFEAALARRERQLQIVLALHRIRQRAGGFATQLAQSRATIAWKQNKLQFG